MSRRHARRITMNQMVQTPSARPRRTGARLLAGLARGALWVTAAPSVKAQGSTPAPARPAVPRLGEAFTFSLKFLGLFDAGRARLAIAPPVKVGTGWQINAVGEAEALGLAKAITGLHFV